MIKDMYQTLSGSSAEQTLQALLDSDARLARPVLGEGQEFAEVQADSSTLKSLLQSAGWRYGPNIFILLCAASATVLSLLLLGFFSWHFLPLYMAAGAYLPYAAVERKSAKRAMAFLEEYPATVMATAASLKAGMSAYNALARAVELLPKESPVKVAVEELLKKLQQGVPREEAVAAFAADIALPDLELFRSAFLLALEHGGQFSHTLDRLARVASDRALLMRAASVSTMTMRMTANVLLFVAPVLVMVLAARTRDYFTLLTEHPTANFLGSAGVVLILGSYLVLQRMSAFRP